MLENMTEEDREKYKTHVTFKNSGVDAMPYDMTGLDYLDQKVEKKGRYGVTVPTPFEFDIRDKVRPKSIRERKVELMVAEIEQEEKDHCNTRFKANPIPSKVLQPQFEKINTANEERRARVKAECVEITKQREKPFSFWERDK